MEDNIEKNTIYYERKVKSGLVGADEKSLAKLISYTYLWMVLGLLTSAITSVIVYQSSTLQDFIYSTKYVFYGLLFAQLAAVILFAKIVDTCRALTAFILYFIYAILTGTTLSVIFLAYQLPSIVETLVCTTLAFAGLSVFGFVTKRNLTWVGNFCISGLFGLVGFGIIFILFPSLASATANMTWSAAGVIVFCGLIAFDTQKLKEILIKSEYVNSQQTATINAALSLYLDFLNLFLDLLSLFGSRK